MKIKRALDSYKELIILIIVIVYLVIKKIPIPIIIMGTVSLGICLYLMKYCINRLISKNEALMELKMKKKTFEENKPNMSSSSIDENRFKEEIQVLNNVINYAESCSQYYNFKGSEAENFIDERCRSFIDLVIPLLAVFPNEYQLVIRTRPSLELYVNKKIKEYIDNRPKLSYVEAEFHKLYNSLDFIQNNTKSDFNMHNIMCAICMIDKYGFSQEVLSVAKGMNSELYRDIFRIYDQRLRSIKNYYDFSYECHKDPENAWKLR